MINCDVIQDLLPLYCDGIASEGSRTLVDIHIKDCPACRDVLEKMKGGGDPVYLSVDKAEIGAFKKIKKAIRRKNIATACVSILCVIALIYGVFGYRAPLPYDPDKMSVKLSYDQAIDVFYDGNCAGANATRKDDAVYIGYEGSLWTRLYYNGKKHQFSIGSIIMIDYSGGDKAITIQLPTNTNANVTRSGVGISIEYNDDKTIGIKGVDEEFAIEQRQINKVYYLDYRKHNLKDAEFEKAKRDAILMWER